MAVFVCLVREYWSAVDLRLVLEPRSLPSDLTGGEEANVMDRPALGGGVLKT